MNFEIMVENHKLLTTLLLGLVLSLTILATIGTASVYADMPSNSMRALPGGIEVCTPSGCHTVSPNYVPPMPGNSSAQSGPVTVQCQNGSCNYQNTTGTGPIPSNGMRAPPGGGEICDQSGCHTVPPNYVPPMPGNSSAQTGPVTCSNGSCNSGPVCSNGQCNGIPAGAQSARPSIPGQNETMTPSNMSQSNTAENMTGNIPTIKSMPTWVKNIFIWYGRGTISDKEMIGALQFLIQQGIIKT